MPWMSMAYLVSVSVVHSYMYLHSGYDKIENISNMFIRNWTKMQSMHAYQFGRAFKTNSMYGTCAAAIPSGARVRIVYLNEFLTKFIYLEYRKLLPHTNKLLILCFELAQFVQWEQENCYCTVYSTIENRWYRRWCLDRLQCSSKMAVWLCFSDLIIYSWVQ